MLTSNAPLFSVSTKEIFPQAEFENCEDIIIKSCRFNSQRIMKGDLYAAMEDPSVDPSGVEEALQRGACGVLARNKFSFSDSCACLVGVPVCKVNNPHAAYAQICQALHGNPGKDLKVIGVTGGYGRRVVAYLIGEILSQAGHKTGILTEKGASIIGMAEIAHAPKDFQQFCEIMAEIVKSYPSEMPGLPPKKSAYWLSRMKQNECKYVVMEVTQTALDKSNAAGIPFHAVCVTRPYRYNAHPSVAGDSAAARSQLIDQVHHEGFTIFNGDDPAANEILAQRPGAVLTFGINGSPQVHGEILEQYLGEQTALITAGSQTIPLRTRIVGRDFLYACLCAIAFGLTCLIDLKQIIRSIESTSIIPGYLQQIPCGRDYSIYLTQDISNDDDPLASHLATIRTVNEGRIFCVMNVPQNQPISGSVDFNLKAFHQKGDKVFLIGCREDNPDFVSNLEKRLNGEVEVFLRKKDAIKAALAEIQPKDALVVAGNEDFHKALLPDHVSDDEQIRMLLERSWV